MTTAALSLHQRSAACLLALGGHSEAMQRLQRQIARVAPHLRSALILSRPGMFATEVARELHRLGPAPESTFLEIPAATLDAAARSHGNHALSALLSAALPGTIVFPDLHRLSSPAQAALLTWLRRPAGISRPRVLAIAPSLLRSEISTGAFSSRLLQGLGSVLVELPSMADRLADLPGLLPSVLEALAAETDSPVRTLTPEALDLLLDHTALGTLSDIHQVLCQLSAIPALDHSTLISSAALLPLLNPQSHSVGTSTTDLDETAPEPPPTHPSTATDAALLTLQEVIDAHLLRVMDHCNGNKLRAADLLGVSRSTLYRMIEHLPAIEGIQA